jgi:hypothetical protein
LNVLGNGKFLLPKETVLYQSGNVLLLLLRLLFIALTTLSLTSVLACKSRRGVFQLLFVIVVQFGESKLLFYEELVKFVLSKRTCMVSSQMYSCVRAEKQAQENKT